MCELMGFQSLLDDLQLQTGLMSNRCWGNFRYCASSKHPNILRQHFQCEAELRRLAAQSKEWVHDLQPEGSALFGAEPSFKSDFSLDPEEARAQAASRRASRMQSREASVAPVESLGILSTCSVSTEQYIDYYPISM